MVKMPNMPPRRWWLAAALAVLGGLLGLAYAALAPQTYTATAYVLVVAVRPGDGTSAVSYAQAYARLAWQAEVVGPAVNNSRGSVTVNDLRNSVRASASPDAPVIEVTGSAGTAQLAADITNLVANSLVSAGRAQARNTQMNLVLLSPAYPPPDPSSPQSTFSVAVGVAVGLLLAGLVFLTRPGGDARGGRGTDHASRPRPDLVHHGQLDGTDVSDRVKRVLAESP
jgi:uncharacterized protein involved in exopolysaccharide biosynthesis